MKDFFSRAPLAVVMIVLLIYGALRLWDNPGSFDGIGVLSAGLVLLGAWLSVDIIRMYEEAKRKRGNGSEVRDDEADE